MPGPWIGFETNPDFYKVFEVGGGDLLETWVYDDRGAPQGTALWEVQEMIEKKKEGMWLKARLVAMSDTHLKWWVTKGEGHQYGRHFKLHLCTGSSTQCKKTKRKRAEEFHTDYLRTINMGDLAHQRIAWFKTPPAVDDVAAEVSRLEGQRKGSGEKGALPMGHDQGAGLALGGDEPPEGEDVRERLAHLRETVSGGKKKGKDKPGDEEKVKKRKKEKKKRKKKKPAEAEKSPMWFGKRKEEAQEVSSSSYETEETSSKEERKEKRRSVSDSGGRRKERKRKEEKEKASGTRPGKRGKRRESDRGPFGTGPKREVAACQAASISSEEEEDDEDRSSFRAAPSGKSKQLQLVEYAERNPGRLASRLLQKMKLLLAREEGAMNLKSGQNLTPSTATSYLLTVVFPLHQHKLNLRVQREMRTISKALDLMAMGENERSADVLAQRLKALEMMVADQTWSRAQHLELLPPEGATLVEADESWMATREQVLEAKMRSMKGKGVGKESDGKGKNHDGKGKNKKGQKWGSWQVNPGEPAKEK